MPIPRFRIRTLMITVAVITTLLAGYRGAVWLANQRDLFLVMEKKHASQEESCRDKLRGTLSLEKRLLDQIASGSGAPKPPPALPAGPGMAGMIEGPSENPRRDLEQVRMATARHRKAADYHASLRHKYEQAARRPWLPVPPDPPPPQ